LEQANARYPIGFYLLLSILLVFIVIGGGSIITAYQLILIPLGLFFGIMPFFFLYSKRRKRMQKFTRQLPDALELIARSLKAGHTFSGGMKMVGEEFSDPIGTEFNKTLDEINFGIAIHDALKNLAKRVDCPDLKFFVVAVIIQRETGGNLAEILGNISYLIRERFKLQGKIRALSAEGRFSAIVLVALPFIVILALSIINPAYISILINEPIGNILIVSALIMMIAGIFVMKKIIAIKV
jgi:tight adherence protein B